MLQMPWLRWLAATMVNKYTHTGSHSLTYSHRDPFARYENIRIGPKYCTDKSTGQYYGRVWGELKEGFDSASRSCGRDIKLSAARTGIDLK